MKFSVLISIYINENPLFLELCLESLNQQIDKPTEIIIVEDGLLSDGLNASLDLWQKKLPIKRIPLKNNVGLGRALNEGLKHCQYNIVARMDTDDIALPDRFSRQLEIFSLNKEISVCGSLISEFENDPSCASSVRFVPEHSSKIKSFAKRKNPINHPSVMFKKSSVLKAGGYLDMPFFEDYYLWCRMLSNGANFYNIQSVLVKMRAGGEQLSRRGGLSYAQKECRFYLALRSIGFINLFEMLSTILIRAPLRLLPLKVLRKIYQLNRK